MPSILAFFKSLFSSSNASRNAVARNPRHLRQFAPNDILAQNVAGKAAPTSYSAAKAIAGGMLASPWAYRCIDLNAKTASSVPWKAYFKGEHQPDSPLQKLLDKPNPDWSGQRLRYEQIGFLQVAGESMTTIRRAKAAGASARVKGEGLPYELWVVSPADLRPIQGGQGRPLILGYRAKNAKSPLPRDIPPTEILHMMFPSLSSAVNGLSPLEPAQRDIDIDNAAADWQKGSFSNRGVPAGVFTIQSDDGDAYYEEDKDEEGDGLGTLGIWKAKMKEAYFGSQNARTPMFLGSEVKWTQLAANAIDMDFQGGRITTREGVLAAFGVPSILAGGTQGAAYGTHLEQAKLWYWESTIMPLLEMMRASFADLAAEFGEDWTINFDTAGVDSLLPLYLKRWAVAQVMLAEGIPMQIVNNRLGLGLSPYLGWDVGTMAASRATTGEVTQGIM